MQSGIDQILITEDQINRRNHELADEILRDYTGKPLTIIILSNGALIFGADLIRCLDIPLELDTLSVSSYIGTRSSRKIRILSRLKLEIAGRHVLIVDDIFDSGLTLETIRSQIAESGAKSVKTCVLLDKRRQRETDFCPDYTGFCIEDRFVVGYGLDFNEFYRNLPYIALLRPEISGEDKK